MRGVGAAYRSIVYRHSRWVEDFAQNWLRDHIEAFEHEVIRHEAGNPGAAELLYTLDRLKSKIKDMTIEETAIPE
jgi:hypothetical protein